jgi:hypothetical protein
MKRPSHQSKRTNVAWHPNSAASQSGVGERKLSGAIYQRL